MKKLLMIAALMVVTLSANTQGMFIKPMVGGTISTLTDFEDAEMKVGLVAGAEFGYNFNEKMGLTAGLLYTLEGCKSKALDENLNMDYLNIPILFNYYILPGLAVKAGVQPGFLMRAKLDGYDWKDHYKNYDLAIPLGVSINISDFVIDARYNLGALINVADRDGATAHNSVFMLTLGYKIPF